MSGMKALVTLNRLRTGAPDIDAGEQKQPHHVDEVPVPGGEFKSEMLRRLELSSDSAEQTNDQKDRTDDHMGAVESGRHLSLIHI